MCDHIYFLTNNEYKSVFLQFYIMNINNNMNRKH